MSRKSRAQQRHRPQRQTASAPARTAKTRPAFDALAYYRSLAAPSFGMRLVLVIGLVCYVAAQLVALSSSKALSTASGLALVGMVGILLFLGGGFVRHQRAIFRIRRESPEAWQSSMRFAVSTLPIPLGFGGRPADSRERLMRWLTLALLLAFAGASLAGSAHR
jgi:hypothetical protein